MRLYDLLLLMERETGGRISLEPISPIFWNHPLLKLDARMNFHNLEYCRFIKRLDANAACARNKRRSMRMATCGHRFCGCCPYGIWELAQPVMLRGKLVAILYFGGFCKREKMAQPVPGNSFQGRMPPEITAEKIEQIKAHAGFAADFIRWELMNLDHDRTTPQGKQLNADFYLQKVRLFFARHYREDIQIIQVAKSCNLTPNYLGDLLKKHTGQTFRQLLTAFRMDEAKVALKYRPASSIAEVAADCGYPDSNYFCTAFKKVQGCSPSAYRKAWLQRQQSGLHPRIADRAEGDGWKDGTRRKFHDPETDERAAGAPPPQTGPAGPIKAGNSE